MTLDRIVVGTDFSCASLEATHWAVHRLAPGAEFVLVHVVEMPDAPSFLAAHAGAVETLREDARVGAAHRLADLELSLGAERVDTEVRVGRAEAELHAVAVARRADMIVVGRRGEREVERGALGHLAESLVRMGDTPVLLATGLHDAAPRRVLAALDDAPGAGAVLAWAGAIAARHAGAVRVLHVVKAAVPAPLVAVGAAGDPDFATEDAERVARVRAAETWVSRVATRALAAVPFTCEAACGTPAREILAASERYGTDVVVIGATGAGGAHRALLGRVVTRVLRDARCAVLVVPTGDADA